MLDRWQTAICLIFLLTVPIKHNNDKSNFIFLLCRVSRHWLVFHGCAGRVYHRVGREADK